MSGGGKKLSTSQRIFNRWMRTESIMRDIDALVKDLVQVRRKIPNREDQVGVRDAVDLLDIAKTKVKFAREKLAQVSDAAEKRRAPPKAKRKPVKVYTGETALFSVMKPSEGGLSFNARKADLEAAGVQNVKRGYSPYVGQYGITVPVQFRTKAEKVLFG